MGRSCMWPQAVHRTMSPSAVPNCPVVGIRPASPSSPATPRWGTRSWPPHTVPASAVLGGDRAAASPAARGPTPLVRLLARVAVLGAGVPGLVTAYRLGCRGHACDVY